MAKSVTKLFAQGTFALLLLASPLHAENPPLTQAQDSFPSIPTHDINGFLNYFCANIELPRIRNLTARIQALLPQLDAIFHGLLFITNPSDLVDIDEGNLAQCIPPSLVNIVGDINFPELDFNACLSNMPDLQVIFGQFGACIQGQLSGFDFNLVVEHVDPASFYQCIQDNLPHININIPPPPVLDFDVLVNAGAGLMAEFQVLIDELRIAYPSKLHASLGWMLNYCNLFESNVTGISGLGASVSTQASVKFKKSTSNNNRFHFTINGSRLATCERTSLNKFNCWPKSP